MAIELALLDVGCGAPGVLEVVALATFEATGGADDVLGAVAFCTEVAPPDADGVLGVLGVSLVSALFASTCGTDGAFDVPVFSLADELDAVRGAHGVLEAIAFCVEVICDPAGVLSAIALSQVLSLAFA